MKTLKYLWHHHRLLLIGFSLATLLTLAFLAKFTFSAIYWANNHDAAIEEWMPIGYIARSYEVDREWLLSQTGVPAEDFRPRQSIEDTAKAAGVSYEEMRARLLTAIEAERAK